MRLGKWFFGLAISVLFLFALGAITPYVYNVSTPVAYSQWGWRHLRTVTASDTPLTSITKAWTAINANTGTSQKFIPIPRGWTHVEIACYADGNGTGTGDPNGGSFSYKVMSADQYGSARLVATGTWAIGELALSHNPYVAGATAATALTYGTTDPNSSKWGELPVVTTDPWLGALAAGTSNDIGVLRFNTRGSFLIWVEVTSLSTLTNLYIVFRGY